MKIVNLNEYSEGEGLRNKLRQRIDNFEPELSDSLWDRIHHEMDQKETQRKKRILWWFTSVAVVVLASGIATFTLVNDNSQPQMAQQPVVVSTPAPAQSETSNTQMPQETATPATTEASATESVAYDATTPNGTGNGRNNGRNNGNSTPRNTAPVAENSPAIVPAATEDRPTTVEPAPIENQQEPLAPENTQAPIVDDNSNNIEEPTTPATETEEKLEEKNTEKGKDNTIDKDTKAKYNKWFIGAVYGYAQNNRTVTDIQPTFGWASAAERNKYEHSGIATTYGIQVGFMATKNVFIKSGVNIYTATEVVKYDIHRRKFQQGSQPDPIYGNKIDSVAVGSTTAHQNSYTYIQIPLEVGFMYDISKRWGVNVSAGAAYNLLNNYNYYLYEPIFGNAFIPSSNLNTNYFQNYVMVSGNAGMHYNIGKNWRAQVGFNYRRAVTSAATKETQVDVRPWSIGGNVALAFSF